MKGHSKKVSGIMAVIRGQLRPQTVGKMSLRSVLFKFEMKAVPV
jgi:hypothetical protein